LQVESVLLSNLKKNEKDAGTTTTNRLKLRLTVIQSCFSLSEMLKEGCGAKPIKRKKGSGIKQSWLGGSPWGKEITGRPTRFTSLQRFGVVNAQKGGVKKGSGNPSLNREAGSRLVGRAKPRLSAILG